MRRQVCVGIACVVVGCAPSTDPEELSQSIRFAREIVSFGAPGVALATLADAKDAALQVDVGAVTVSYTAGTHGRFTGAKVEGDWDLSTTDLFALEMAFDEPSGLTAVKVFFCFDAGTELTNYATRRSLYMAGILKPRRVAIPVRKSELTVVGNADWTHVRRVEVRLSRFDPTHNTVGANRAQIHSLWGDVSKTTKVLLTFDDGSPSVYSVVFPAMRAAGMRGTAYLTGYHVGRAGTITLAQAQELYAAGWDLANHTWQHTPITLRGGISRVGSLATFTSFDSYDHHGLTEGSNVTIGGADQPEYNGTFEVLSTPAANRFTFSVTGTPRPSASGVVSIPIMSDDAIRAAYLHQEEWLWRNGFVRGAGHFAYPKGYWDEHSLAVLKALGVKTARIADAGALQGLSPTALGLLDPFQIPVVSMGSVTAESVLSSIDSAIANGSDVVCMGHKVADGVSGAMAISEFEALIDGLVTRRNAGSLEVVTISEWSPNEPAALAEIFADTGFPDPGVSFSGSSGVYTSNFDPDEYGASWSMERTIYVDLASGNDMTGTGLPGAPYKTVSKGMATAATVVETTIEIRVITGGADVVFYRDEFYPPTPLSITARRIHIAPDDSMRRLYVTTAQRTSLDFTLAGGRTETYRAFRSNVTGVADFSSKDDYGIPSSYERKSSIDEVEANAGSWYENAGVVYVHTVQGGPPVVGTHLVYVRLNPAQYSLAAGAELFLRNVYFVGSPGSHTVSVYGTGGDTTFVAWNCAFARANPTYIGSTGSNGLRVNSVRRSLIFNSVAPYNSADGFNFHYLSIGDASPRDYFAVVVNSVAYDNGIGNTVTPNINNAFTSHDGAHFACVGCRGWNTQGAVFAMGNAVNAVIIGSQASASAHGVVGSALHAAYYFDAASAPAGVSAAAYLFDSFGDDSVYDLSSDGNVLITLSRFAGADMPAATSADVTYRWPRRGHSPKSSALRLHSRRCYVDRKWRIRASEAPGTRVLR